MNILVTGGTGFVGRALCRDLVCEGHSLTLVVRRKKSLPADWGLPGKILVWDPTKEDCPHDLSEFDAVVHLMGESIAAGRWTVSRKARIQASRGLATRRLATALNKRKKPVDCFISASAIGYYAYDLPQGLSETAAPAEHFLAQVCQDWEAAAKLVPAQRSLILRLGMILGPDGGAMERLRPLFAAGLGGRLGSGHQVMSWIHRDDVVAIISKALKDTKWRGLYNCVSPSPVSNREFTAALARTLERPALLPAPAIAMKAAFGQMSDILLKSQKIIPERLQQEGFQFKYPDLTQALADVCSLVEQNGSKYPCLRFESQQFVARNRSEVFTFFCNPHNLERLTPTQLSFKILDISTPQIGEGSIIQYKLKLYGIPFRWKTLIREWKPEQQFIDTQEKGPYAIWHHTHRFHAVPGGTLMVDIVRYRLPMGWLGELFGLPIVKREVRGIFAFRRQIIAKIFGDANS